MIKTYKLLFFFVFLFSQSWSQTNIPPELVAIGDQIYCPLSQINIVTDFDIIDPDDIELDVLKILISEGYVEGEDMLSLIGSHPNIVAVWDSKKGKLTLRGVGNAPMLYSDLINAVKSVVYSSTSVAVSGEKFFVITIGPAEYLPLTDHYYEFIPDIASIWTNARFATEVKDYYGLQGYLATVLSTEEALLTGELALGLAWIGGSEATNIGTWKWETGPEAGTVFWEGDQNGSTPNFANWMVGEPRTSPFQEHFAAITKMGNLGEWDNMPRTGSQTGGPFEVKGYIIEYGGMPNDPLIKILGKTKVTIPKIDNVVEASRCGTGSIQIEAIPSAGITYWFSSLTGGKLIGSGAVFNTPIITNTTTFYALASPVGCFEGVRIPVVATVNEIPSVESSVVLTNCDEDGISDGFTDFNLNEANAFIINGDTSDFSFTYYLSYSDADNNVNAINSVPFNNNTASTVYARVESIYGCYNVSTVNLNVSTSSLPSGYMQELKLCDEDPIIDGLKVFDLSQASANFINEFPVGQSLSVHYFRNSNDAQFGQNEILPQSRYKNEIPFSQVLYVRIQSKDNGACFGYGPYLTLTVNPRPEFEVGQSEIFCKNSLQPVTLFAFNAKDNYTYRWLDSSKNVISNLPKVDVSSGGNYTVVGISDLGCESFPITVTVIESATAIIANEDVTVESLSNNNTISINNDNLGIGDYEFSLDNISGSYQSTPIFTNVSAGDHIVYIKDLKGCGVSEFAVFIMGFPKFFTPNGDGYNDTWNIIGLSNEFKSNSTVSIYDRYGSLIKQLNPWGEGWNGFRNGEELIASDYWFVAQLIENSGSIKTVRGHFSLIR